VALFFSDLPRKVTPVIPARPPSAATAIKFRRFICLNSSRYPDRTLAPPKVNRLPIRWPAFHNGHAIARGDFSTIQIQFAAHDLQPGFPARSLDPSQSQSIVSTWRHKYNQPKHQHCVHKMETTGWTGF